jgi:hypothetical protein
MLGESRLANASPTRVFEQDDKSVILRELKESLVIAKDKNAMRFH